MKLRAFAKINLDLRIVGKRQDGFHELCTVFQAIDWFDEIEPGKASPSLTSFQSMGGAAVSVLRAELKSDDVSRKLKAAWALGSVGPAASNAIPDLISCLDDPVNNLPVFAMQALGTIVPEQVTAIPQLLLKLSDPNQAVSNAAEVLLGKIEQARKACDLPTYSDEFGYDTAFLQASSQRVRLIGLQRLMRISPSDGRVEATFKSLASDSNNLIREQSILFTKNHER